MQIDAIRGISVCKSYNTIHLEYVALLLTVLGSYPLKKLNLFSLKLGICIFV